MYNILTGTEISATKENIKSYFDKLDTKADGVIDFEEFQQSLCNNSKVGEWFEIVNREISEKLGYHKETIESEFILAIKNIENSIESCIADLTNPNDKNITLNDEKSDFSDNPDILFDSNEKPDVPNGDEDSLFSFCEHSLINLDKSPSNSSKITTKLLSILDSLQYLKTFDNSLKKENLYSVPVLKHKNNPIR